jgi:thioesterase domain-containing protein
MRCIGFDLHRSHDVLWRLGCPNKANRQERRHGGERQRSLDIFRWKVGKWRPDAIVNDSVTEMSSVEHMLNPQLRRSISFALESWPGDRAKPDFLIRKLTASEGGPNFFWCTNGADENVALLSRLDETIAVYGLRTMFGFADATNKSIRSLASLYADEIIQIQPTGPYRLGGYCLGGLIALEIARSLSEKGCTIDKLILVEVSPWNRYPTLPSYMAVRRMDDEEDSGLSDDGVSRTTDILEPCLRPFRRIFIELKAYLRDSNHRWWWNIPVKSADFVRFEADKYAGSVIFIFGLDSYFAAMTRAAYSVGAWIFGPTTKTRWFARTDLTDRAEIRFVTGPHLLFLDPAACVNLSREISDCLRAANASTDQA